MTDVNTLPTQLGTIDGQPIIAQVNSGSLATVKTVVLTADYIRQPPPGWVDPQPGQGQNLSLTAWPQTVPSASTMVLHACEADALIAASAATLA